MRGEDRRYERLVALVLLGVVAFNFPVVGLFSHAGIAFGVPVLYLYLFLVWLGFIGASALLMEREALQRTEADQDPPDA